MVNNKKMKKLMAVCCVKVCRNTDEVSWITEVSLKGNGATKCFTRYLGGLDEDCYTSLQNELKVLNLPKQTNGEK